ncbi:hypothetical protein CEPID_02885 [Corynebacterium epidermidicanis]|uniref:Uncharacterized protein n=1 Tax=Corynebacterium epidermidicanis TaxID=1050174 RepID=A0A0G3GUA3_9CORY|nr:hypothetical protein CEPID_02885 [Corynebacterium epidermidicanis]
MDVNGGRFYARPLRDNDAPALAQAANSVASLSPRVTQTPSSGFRIR